MKKINKAIIKCAVIIVMIGFSFVKSYAQGTLLNETTLERTMYENDKKGINPFDNILEQHVYVIDINAPSNDVKKLIKEIKKDEKVVSVSKEEDKIIVLIYKSEMQDASHKLTPFFDSMKISVKSNYVLYYFKK